MEIVIKHPKYNREIKSFMPFPDMQQVAYVLEELKLVLVTGVVVKLLDTPFSYIREGMYWREVTATATNTYTYQIEDEEETYSPPQPPSNKPYKKPNKREKRKEKKSNYQHMGACDKALETPLEVDPEFDEFDDSDRDNEPEEVVVEKTNGVDKQPLEGHKGMAGSTPVVTEKKEVFFPDKIPSKEYVKNEIFSFRK